MTAHVPALVVGAGISGLVCAYALRKAGIDAQVVESSANPGGVIATDRRDGYLLEYGPQSFTATSAVLNLCRELQVDNQLVQAPPKAPRFVLIKNQLRHVPLNPPSFIASSLFSATTKWRVLRDFLGHSAPPEGSESVAAFTRRKFTPEVLEKLVGPFVSGIYAGDPEKLGLRSAFPQLYEAEKFTGSVIRGLLRAGKNRSGTEKPTLQSFRNGNQTLTDALVANLGSNLRCGTEVRSVRLASSSLTASTFEVTILANGQQDTITTEQLIIATPASQAAAILRGVNPRFESALTQFEYAPVAVVSLGYPKAAIRHSLNGFGFLVPRSSGLRILGTVWNSSLFPGRAPENHVLLTSFGGGVTDPQAASLSESELVATVHRELAPILGISQQQPAFANVKIWPRAIPQFNIGHFQRISDLALLQSRYPGLSLVGNYLHGPSLGVCLEQALTVAPQAGMK
ncbi:MAG: protoporphyrinogen oxidase [Candidatus Acidiferrum sp.]